MKVRSQAQIFVSALIVAATLGSMSVAEARGKGGHSGGTPPPVAPPVLATITGTIQTIDIAKKKMTIVTGVGTSLLLTVGNAASVTRNGAPSALKGLVLNDSVTGLYDVAKLTAAALAATGPAASSVAGKVAALSFGSGTLTVGSTKLQTTAGTLTSRNGQMVALRQLTLRDSVIAHASTGTNVALDVVASGPSEVEVKGIIAAVTANSVTITPDDGSAPVTVTIAPATHIEVNDGSGTIADLLVSQSVEVEYDPTTLVAFSISTSDEGEDGEVEGLVVSVDTVAGTVTIAPKDGSANITLTVNAATEVDVNDAHSTLAGVLAGMPIKAEFAAGTLLARQIEAGATETETEGD